MWSIFIHILLITVVPDLSLIYWQISILSMLLHNLLKYRNLWLAPEGQSSPVSALTPVWPFLLWLTTHTKEPQWPAVKGVLGHPLATAGADRGKVSGSGVREMPHARSSVTQLRPLEWHWLALREDPSTPLTAHHLQMDVIHSGYQFPLMRMACNIGMIQIGQSVRMPCVCIAAT